MRFRASISIFCSILLLCIIGCNSSNSDQLESVLTNRQNFPILLDLDKISERKKIIALTDNSSTSFFIYKGQPMGYEYELLSMYADHMKLELQVKVVHDLNNIFNLLNHGEGDIIAANLTITKKRNQIVSFTLPHIQTRQVLVQKKPVGWRKMQAHKIEQKLIRNPIDLIGKDVFVRKNSSFYTRLNHLSDEIGGDINIKEVPGDVETEQLIQMVAEGLIPITVADENVALLNATYFSDLDVKTAISFPQRIAWAVRKNSPELLLSLNAWIESIKNKSEYATIYNKYYRSSKTQIERAKSNLSSTSGNQISEFDELIKIEAAKLGWDWKLLASQIYQESHFDPKAQAWTGATGLLQLLPSTASQYNVNDLTDPAENLAGAVQYLIWLDDYWKKSIENKEERIKFVLASYNVGLGHIIDARRLARKYDKKAGVWEGNCDEMIKLKSRPKYFNDEVVKHGYCRGSEPYRYVKEILGRFEYYTTLFDKSEIS